MSIMALDPWLTRIYAVRVVGVYVRSADPAFVPFLQFLMVLHVGVMLLACDHSTLLVVALPVSLATRPYTHTQH